MKKICICVVFIAFLFIVGSSCAKESQSSIWKMIDVNRFIKSGPSSTTLITERLDLPDGSYIIRSTAIGCTAISVHSIHIK